MQLQATRTERIDRVQPDERVLDPDSGAVVVVDEKRVTSAQVQLLGFPLGRTGGRRISIAAPPSREVELVPEPGDAQHLAAVILRELREHEKRVIEDQQSQIPDSERGRGGDVAVAAAPISVDVEPGRMRVRGARGVTWDLSIVQDAEPDTEALIDGQIEPGHASDDADD